MNNFISMQNIENIAKYQAIALVGRDTIDKLMSNGLIIINANDLEKLQADLHALSAQVEISKLSKQVVE